MLSMGVVWEFLSSGYGLLPDSVKLVTTTAKSLVTSLRTPIIPKWRMYCLGKES